MALRYSGQIRVSVLWSDSDCNYRCVLSAPQSRTVQFVGPPAELRRAVDAPESYDDAARAALAFADAELWEGSQLGNWGEAGPVVTRRKADDVARGA